MLRSTVLFALAATILRGQESDPGREDINGRVFGLMSNHRTADGSAPFEPITVRRKFYIGTMDIQYVLTKPTIAAVNGVPHALT